MNVLRIKVRCVQCEFSHDISEGNLVINMAHRSNIDIEFARFFANKGANELGLLKHHHEDIAELLGHSQCNGDYGLSTRSLTY